MIFRAGTNRINEGLAFKRYRKQELTHSKPSENTKGTWQRDDVTTFLTRLTTYVIETLILHVSRQLHLKPLQLVTGRVSLGSILNRNHSGNC